MDHQPVPELDGVHCGDNAVVLAAWPAEFVDLVVTSPPYGALRKYGGDDWDFAALAPHLWRTLKPGGTLVWNVADETIDGGESGDSFRQALRFMELGFTLYDTMIWDKDSVTVPTESRYYNAWEFMFVFAKGRRPKTINLLCDRANREPGRVRKDAMTRCSKEGRAPNAGKVYVTPDRSRRTNVWRVNPAQDAAETAHPAVMPLAIARAHVASWSAPGDLVLDPFAGSATTLVAAKELGRRWLGVEINPTYCQLAAARLAQEQLPLGA